MIKPVVRFAVLFAASISASAWAQTFEPLYQFSGTDGAAPEQTMTIGPDGSLYGVTSGGGIGATINTPTGGGVAFRFSVEEGFTKLADFNNPTTGSKPTARLLSIGDGFLYGATYYGGTGGGGTVFRLDPVNGGVTVISHVPGTSGVPRHPMYLASGEPNVLHVLCEDTSGIRRLPLDNSPETFTLATPGTPRPQSFIRAMDGYLYGATIDGGTTQDGTGTLFRVDPNGSNYLTIHDCAKETGYQPKGAMVQAKDGSLYGVTTNGGLGNEVGVLYRLTKTGADQYSYSVVRRFNDFDELHCDLLLATDGMLYGTGKFIGPGGNGNGGVWRIRTDGTGYKVLHVFLSGTGTGYPTGRNPIGGLVQAPDGNIYGTTAGGVGGGFGTIFRIKLNLPPPPINRPPLAVGDITVSNGEAVTVSVLANDFDTDGDTVLVTIKTPPTFGAAVVQPNGTVVYTPSGNYAGTDAFTYELNDQRGGKSSALVQVTDTALPILFQPGAYNGLVSADSNLDGENLQPRGQFQLSIKETGVFSGTLFTQKKRIALKGTFDSERATAKVKLPDGKLADVYFAFRAGNPSTIIAGFFGTENWTAEAGPVRPSGETTKQRYTIQIAANPAIVNGPVGHGYGTVTVKPTGAVIVIGKLGDGSPLKWATSITELPGVTRVIPAYSVPLKLGIISGLLSASNVPGEDFVGPLTRTRPFGKSNQPFPAGFNGEVTATIGKFVPPGPTAPVITVTSAGVRLEGPGLAPSIGQFTIDAKKIVPDGDLKAFTINRTTGVFSGTMKNGTKTFKFSGAVNQAVNTGLGYFTIGLQTGKVEFIF